jgi:O-antigen ligase
MFDRRFDRIGLTLLTAGLVGVAIFLPWRTFLTNFLILISAAFWLLLVRDKKTFLTRECILFLCLLCSVYLVEVIGLLYTDNIAYGLHRIESKLSLIAFPVLIFVSKIEKKHSEKIQIAFVASTVIACLVCLITAIVKLVKKGQTLPQFFKSSEYSNVDLTEPLQKIHPTFLTLFICLAIFLICDYLRTRRKHYWLFVVILLMMFTAFQLASRAGYLALVCTLVFIGFAFIGMQRKVWLIVYSCIMALTFILTITLVPTVKKRLVDSVLEADINIEEANSVSYHFKTWYCSIDSWLDNHIIFGYGTGDEVDTITQCYQSKRWLGYGHDAHNEFLSSLVKHGLFGLTVFLGFFFYPFYLALKFRNLRYFAFLTIILICFLSESMLRGQTGLVFFTLFNTLFLKEMLIEKNVLRSASED